MSMAHCSISLSFRRSIGSLVIGHLAQNGLTKNTLSAIQLATAFGDVRFVSWLEGCRFRCGCVEMFLMRTSARR